MLRSAPKPFLALACLVTLTASTALAQKAPKEAAQALRDGLAKLEAVLSARLGAERMRALRDALFADWGSVPQPDGEDRHRVAR